MAERVVSPRRRLTPLITLEDLWRAGFGPDFIADQAANEVYHWGHNDPTEPYSGVTILFDADAQTCNQNAERSEWNVVFGLEIERIPPGPNSEQIG